MNRYAVQQDKQRYQVFFHFTGIDSIGFDHRQYRPDQDNQQSNSDAVDGRPLPVKTTGLVQPDITKTAIQGQYYAADQDSQ